MARPQKAGLEYFPLDVDMANDERVEFLEAKYGVEGFGTLIHLLSAIYRNGYYLPWGEIQIYTTAKRINLPVTHLTNIVNLCITIGLFDVYLWETYGVLTSHGIQARYIKACDYRKKIKMVREFCLITPDDGVKEGRFQYIDAPKVVSLRKTPISHRETTEKPAEVEQLSEEKPLQSKVKESNKDVVVVTPYNPPQKGDEDMELETGVAEKDEATANVFTLFENNVHPITGQIEADTLTDLLDHYGEIWLTEAIKESALRNGRSVKYIQSILEAWERDGFKAPKPERSKTNERGIQGTRRKNQREQGEDEPSESRKEFYASIERVKNRPKPWEVQRADGQ